MVHSLVRSVIEHDGTNMMHYSYMYGPRWPYPRVRRRTLALHAGEVLLCVAPDVLDPAWLYPGRPGSDAHLVLVFGLVCVVVFESRLYEVWASEYDR